MDRQHLEKIYDNIAIRLKYKNELFGNSINKYIGLIKRYPRVVSYDYISDEVKKFCESIIYSIGHTFLENFHKLILLQLIMENVKEINQKDFPKEIQSLYLINFERIVKEIEADSYKGPFLYINDKFSKDLAVCCLRMIPVGARKINLSRLSKRFVFKKGVKQFLTGLTYIFFELKGLSPFYTMHTDSKDPHLVKELNQDGWINSYHLIAKLLRSNKDVRGVFAASWFYDPQLEYISPKFFLSTKIALNNGGKIFYLGPDEQAIRDATLKSETRKKLYKEGKYLPTRYLLIWSRKKLLNWSEKIYPGF